jgi:hypothetical protein
MAFYRSTLDEIRSIPGVQAASASTAAPFVAFGWSFSLPARDAGGERRQIVRVNVASPDYFDALRVPMLSGREMSADEHRGGADVVVISRSAARLLFGDADAVGREFEYSGRRWSIVGVVPDLRQGRLQEAQVPEIYLPWHNAGQRPQAVLVRAAAVTLSLRDQIVQRVRALDPAATVAEAGSLEERVARTLAPQRFRAMLVAGLAGLASLLAMFGVYSVTAFTVATQAREQAIRVALGETREGARRRVVLASLRPAAVGALLGVAAAWASSRFVESFLFEIRADDPRALAAAPAALILFALIAAWVPASRASRLDPAAVLREGV